MLTSTAGLVKAYCPHCKTFRHVKMRSEAVCCEPCGIVIHWLK